MKKTVALVILLGLYIVSFAQKEVKLEDISKYVGDSVTVEGPVKGGRYMANAKGTPTLLNMGNTYPNQLLTLVVWGDQRSNFKTAPEDAYLNKTVRVHGKVILFHDKPEIVIYREDQIELVGK